MISICLVTMMAIARLDISLSTPNIEILYEAKTEMHGSPSATDERNTGEERLRK